MSSKVVCFGEVLFDVFPDGKKIGGAPFNVAAHLRQLDNQVSLISRIGEDANGSEVLSAVSSFKMSTDTIQLDSRLPTGLVNVTIDEQGNASYDIQQPSSWDNIASSKKDLSLVAEADALVFGSLASRGAKSKSSLLKFADSSNLNICDLNIRQDYYDKKLLSTLLELTHVLKINSDEANLLKEMFDFPDEEYHRAIGDKFGISVIIETKGKDGAIAYSGGRTLSAPGLQVNVVDTLGSGDAFLAAFVHHFLKHQPLEDCLINACRRGAQVASHQGAIGKM